MSWCLHFLHLCAFLLLICLSWQRPSWASRRGEGKRYCSSPPQLSINMLIIPFSLLQPTFLSSSKIPSRGRGSRSFLNGDHISFHGSRGDSCIHRTPPPPNSELSLTAFSLSFRTLESHWFVWREVPWGSWLPLAQAKTGLAVRYHQHRRPPDQRERSGPTEIKGGPGRGHKNSIQRSEKPEAGTFLELN